MKGRACSIAREGFTSIYLILL